MTTSINVGLIGEFYYPIRSRSFSSNARFNTYDGYRYRSSMIETCVFCYNNRRLSRYNFKMYSIMFI